MIGRADTCPDPLRHARDHVLGLAGDPPTFCRPPSYAPGVADRIAACGVLHGTGGGPPAYTRGEMLDTLANSVIQIDDPFNQIPDNEEHVGFASTFSGDLNDPGFLHGQWPEFQRRLLMRVTACPGDFNRDGCADQADLDAFDAASAGLTELYADWNFSWEFFGPIGPHIGETVDEFKFDAEHTQAVCGCNP
jgi:hypothetical protein